MPNIIINDVLEEKINAITHGIGAFFAVIALIVLIARAYLDGGLWQMVAAVVYGVSLVLLYLASTLYHSFSRRRVKEILKFFDHAAIYILIAGNYTPFTLIPLHGTFGWAIFGIIWGLALAGIVFKIFFVKRFKFFSTLCYLLMGWLAIFMVKPLLAVLPAAAIYWLVAGGLLYTIGTIFYLDKKIPYNHAVWHLFVIGGSVSHFITVFKYVMPMPVM
ncbi:PAQR family membrane homeostasis protein TrhA [Pectinatus haikarae]|uniref:Hemolysin III n=1 Tax=Pectinatus haikarae TaxID=349096 RepID=A0ABT9Y964_9FIRM|nr:hemolysin III family protein [Pectinatus haikarae]MDQ0204178.1 hemolysin III [Pectinatus haikarae]